MFSGHSPQENICDTIFRMKASVSPKILKALSRPALGPWLLRVALDWMQIILAFALIIKVPHPLTYFIAWFVIGIRMNALELLMHDAAHFTLSRNRTLNDFLGYAFISVPLGASLSGYRFFHLEHHRHQGTDRDPEIHYQSKLGRWERPLSQKRLIYLFITDLLGFGIIDVIKGLEGIKPKRKFEYALNAAFMIAALLVVWTLNLWIIPAFWLFCAVTSHWAIFRVRTFTEHGGVDVTHRFSSNPVFRYIFFPHNTHMHYEHHTYPTVPLWNLPKLRESIQTEQKIVDSKGLLKNLSQTPNFPWA